MASLPDEYYILANRRKFDLDSNIEEKELAQATNIISHIKNGTYVKYREEIPVKCPLPTWPINPDDKTTIGVVYVDSKNPDNFTTTKTTYYKYEDFLTEVSAWRKKNEDRAAKDQIETTPFTPKNSGNYRHFDDYTALNISSSDGVFSVAMRHSFETGDNSVGWIVFASEKYKACYNILCIDFDPSAKSLDAFLAHLSSENLSTTQRYYKVNTTVPSASPFTGLLHPRLGTCQIEITLQGGVKVSEKDSPQHDDGKERVPVNYRPF